MAVTGVTLLDSEQVIQHSFDESQQALRVTGSLDIAAPTGTQAVSGTVSVNNFPANQTVTVSNFPATQSITGAVSVTNLPSTQAVSGGVSVLNLPSTQAVTGSVSVNNFPTTQAISGSVGVTGSVSVLNFPSTQAVSGSIGVNNFPSTQAVSGTVGVSNFPTVQAVSGNLLVSNGTVFSNFNIDSSTIAAATGSFTQITASTSRAITQIAVYDTTGANLQIATGAAASETTAIYLGPGDSGTYPLAIPSGTRLSIRSLDASAPATGANIIVRLIG